MGSKGQKNRGRIFLPHFASAYESMKLHCIFSTVQFTGPQNIALYRRIECIETSNIIQCHEVKIHDGTNNKG